MTLVKIVRSDCISATRLAKPRQTSERKRLFLFQKESRARKSEKQGAFSFGVLSPSLRQVGAFRFFEEGEIKINRAHEHISDRGH